MEAQNPPGEDDTERKWRGPRIAEIAREAGVGTATVDRVLNGRSNVHSSTRNRVLSASERIRQPITANSPPRHKRIAFISDSGVSFNQTLENTVRDFVEANPGECPSKASPAKCL